MNRDQAAARWTTVLAVLFLNEPIKSFFFDTLQVIFYAHAEIASVSGIHTIDLFAGILAAFITEGRGCRLIQGAVEPGALLEQVGTSPVPGPAPAALGPLQAMDMGEIPAAEGTVHAAWRDQFIWVWIGLLHCQRLSWVRGVSSKS